MGVFSTPSSCIFSNTKWHLPFPEDADKLFTAYIPNPTPAQWIVKSQLKIGGKLFLLLTEHSPREPPQDTGVCFCEDASSLNSPFASPHRPPPEETAEKALISKCLAKFDAREEYSTGPGYHLDEKGRPKKPDPVAAGERVRALLAKRALEDR